MGGGPLNGGKALRIEIGPWMLRGAGGSENRVTICWGEEWEKVWHLFEEEQQEVW